MKRLTAEQLRAKVMRKIPAMLKHPIGPVSAIKELRDWLRALPLSAKRKGGKR